MVAHLMALTCTGLVADVSRLYHIPLDYRVPQLDFLGNREDNPSHLFSNGSYWYIFCFYKSYLAFPVLTPCFSVATCLAERFVQSSLYHQVYQSLSHQQVGRMSGSFYAVLRKGGHTATICHSYWDHLFWPLHVHHYTVKSLTLISHT